MKEIHVGTELQDRKIALGRFLNGLLQEWNWALKESSQKQLSLCALPRSTAGWKCILQSTEVGDPWGQWQLGLLWSVPKVKEL